MAVDKGAAAVRVRIEGSVQGVWYRAWTLGEARARGLRGWVRNCADGSVEAVFAGAEAAVRDMIDACRQGPPAAVVTRITESPAEDDVGEGFRLLPMA